MPPLRYVKVHAFLDLFLKFCSIGVHNYSNINTQSDLLELDIWRGKLGHCVVVQCPVSFRLFTFPCV